MIYTRRGNKPSIAKSKIDVILTAVKMSQDGKLVFARGYIRRGDVWGDRVVIDRAALLERLKDGQKIFTGVEAEIIGDFETWKSVTVSGVEDNETLTLEDAESGDEQLGLPLL